MELKIYSQDGTLKMTASTDSSSVWNDELMVENAVSASFTYPSYVLVEPGDYVSLGGTRFSAQKQYKPKQKSTLEYAYSCKFYGPEHDAGRVLYLNLTDGQYDSQFSLDGSPREHLQKWVDNMNRVNGYAQWSIGDVVVAANKTIDYDNATCWDAIAQMAEAFGTEWWADDHVINLSRCERGERVELGYTQGLTSLTQSDNSDDVRFFTRLIPLGSTRNIDPERYGYTRLQLPSRAKYVDRNTTYGLYEQVEEDAFADIFPHYTGTVTSVRQEQRTGDDGNPFTVYYFGDSGMMFNPADNEIAGLVKRVSFQSGDLNGQGDEDDGNYYFEANWHSDTLEWEIINTYPSEGTQIPGGNLIPRVGDKYIPWNIRMPHEYETQAEQDFAAAVADYLAKYSDDVSKYGGETDYLYVDQHSVPLQLGQSVRLMSGQYFGAAGYMDSRLTKVSRKLDNLSMATIECTNVVGQGWKKGVDSSLGQLKYVVAKQREETPLDILKSWDGRAANDYRVLSALRSIMEIQRRAISKTANDETEGLIKFLQGLESGAYSAGESGASIDDEGNAEFLSAVIRGILRSTVFTDGLTGEGFALWKDAAGLANLTLDRLTVRQTMTVMELLISKVRSTGGQIIVSAANGKIKVVDRDDKGNYLITFETANMFVPHDLMRCATFTGATLKSYWAEVASVDGDTVTIPASEFTDSVPEVGDECVLMGNTANTGRQDLISISATEDGSPRVDVLDGVSAKSLDGSLRVRLGQLDGIYDSWFPADNQPHGDGLYGDNVYLRGSFLLLTGEDVLTKFQVTEGMIHSEVDSVRKDFMEDKGYLSNATFGSGMDKWDTTNEATFFLLGTKWIWLNSNIYAKKGDYAAVRKDDGRTAVYIKNGFIRQLNANLRSKPTFLTNGDGYKESVPVYLSFFYRAVTAGTLTVEFENVDKTGFEDFTPLDISRDLNVTDGYEQFYGEGQWNGTGDFKLSYTGEIYLYMLILSTDKVEALKNQYRTLFEQSDRLAKISVAVFDKNQNLLEETGLVITDQLAGLYAIDGDGNLKSFVGAGQDGVKIAAASITLEGLVTANDNFKILEDGSVEAVNGKFSGQITASSGQIGYFSINTEGLYYGDPSKWADGSYKQDLASITPGLIRLQREAGYFAPGDLANIKVGLGDGADPALASDKDCYSAGYFYRQMNADIGDQYYPAVKIVSDNVINRDVALYTEGAAVIHGGLLEAGRIMDLSSVNVIDLSFGTNIIAKNMTGTDRNIYLPTLANMKLLMNSDAPFVTHVKVNTQFNNSGQVYLGFQDGETTLYFRGYQGEQAYTTISMGPGDSAQIQLVWDGTNYYAALLQSNA
jgi:hypothetical protein